MTATGLDIAKFQADLINPVRSFDAVEQRNWLLQKLQQSTATWNVLGQQILMSKMFVPAELLMSLAEITAGNPSPETLSKITTQITELLEIKARMDAGDPTVTPEEKARLAVTAPYNLDAWDGYFAEREILYGTLAQLKKKVVVLAGDTHNAWASDLSSKDGVLVGVELATSSVSSPGLEKYLSIPMQQLQAFEFAFTSLIDELNYCNLNQRGYLKVHFTAEQVQADWIFVDTIKNKEYIVDETRSHQVILDPTFFPISALKQTA